MASQKISDQRKTGVQTCALPISAADGLNDANVRFGVRQASINDAAQIQATSVAVKDRGDLPSEWRRNVR